MKKRVIKIHNELAMAKYRMSLSEQKLFIYAIKNINQDEDSFSSSVFPLVEFAENAELDHKHVYNEIDTMITSIMKTVISVKGKNPNRWRKYNLTQTCYYEDGEIGFKFNEDMRVFLLQLKKQYFLQDPVVIAFKSWYSMRLYDMFKSYSYKDEPFEIELDELKDILGIGDKYARFNNFREKVVEVALNEINEKSDIHVTMEKKTVGSKVIGLSFEISGGEDRTTGTEYLNDIEEIKIKAKLQDSGFTDKQILKLYEQTVARFSEYRDANDLYLYMSINYKYMKKKNPGNQFGYYKECLANDYSSAITQIMTGYVI